MKYLLPQLEVTGKRPFWSVEILSVTVMDLMNTRLEKSLGSMMRSCSERADVSGINVGRTGFVYRML